MMFIPKSDFTAQISELETKVSELETKVTDLSTDIASKTDALVKASEEITNLSTEVSNLKPFKEKADELAEQENQRILSEKKESLKKIALKSGFILESELSEDTEISQAIESVDESAIKLIIATRLMKKLDEKTEDTTESLIEQSELDVKSEVATANINLDDESYDPLSIMNSFLKR